MTEGPLREPSFLILTALAAEPQHGYGIIEDVLRISDGRVRLQAGTLYGVLDRLRTDGLVEVDREEVVSSRLRRYYRLTGSGVQLLASETERLRRNSEAAANRLRALGIALGGRPLGGAALDGGAA
jgi:DNA-binding PadR family transcriptional regulator